MKKGFSLVELSIVLVILGLLVGGILADQSLIRASELRSVQADISRYQTAIFAFRNKYMGLPGDLRNATSFWGDNNTNCPDPDIPNGTPGTCNGDGNGKIYAWSESVLAWPQLAYAGLIEGSYSGIGSMTTAAAIPRLKLSNVYINYYWSTAAGGGGTGDSPEPNRFVIGTLDPASGTSSGAAFKPEEAWNIDMKLDDGMPQRGKMVTSNATINGSGVCYTGNDYALNNNATACYFSFVAP